MNLILKTPKSPVYSKTNKFFEIGEDIKNNINKISYFLHYHIKNLNQQNISPELSAYKTYDLLFKKLVTYNEANL